MEKKMKDPPIHPNLSRMWMEMFDRVNRTPLQKLMVQVNRGSSVEGKKKQLSKKELIEQLHDIILKIDHERGCIERFKESCLDMLNELHQSNRVKGTKIPEE
jgi:hypothetical protein